MANACHFVPASTRYFPFCFVTQTCFVQFVLIAVRTKYFFSSLSQRTGYTQWEADTLFYVVHIMSRRPLLTSQQRACTSELVRLTGGADLDFVRSTWVVHTVKWDSMYCRLAETEPGERKWFEKFHDQKSELLVCLESIRLAVTVARLSSPLYNILSFGTRVVSKS